MDISVFFNTPIILFYISLIVIVGMLTIKASEIRSGKKYWISKITDKTNHIIYYYSKYIRKSISYINRRAVLALVQWITYHILTYARNSYIWAYKKAYAHKPSKKVIDMVKGKGDINKNTGSSFYLKSISKNHEEVI